MSLRDQMLQTAYAYTAVHNEQTFDTLLALCSPDCVHRIGPMSIKNPDRNNDEYIRFNTEVCKRMHTYHAEIMDAVVDEASRKVVVYIHSKGTAPAGEYENEYVITLTMTEDGKKVAHQYDFMDSQTMLNWIAKVGKPARENWGME
ncbi:hypothetical protein BP6252_06658 [Coleophoma cylindrospora]|uniref:SnoaL-like domain-containing protein n=1 Tax=Coleophoma cylindrospora TaxID=1849047 RepID=A0A3D8RNI8_9HELO|nr:hypothetical protein BP6252_06658 [Coleophoma cylindrospora]